MRVVYDGDLGLDEVSDIFKEKGWEYAVPDCYGIPGPEELRQQILRMHRVMEEDDLDYIHSGRIALVRDGDVDGTFQVLITAGYLYAGEEADLF